MRANGLAFTSPKLEILTDSQKKSLHLAALEILERTGVVVKNKTAVQLLKQSGAFVEEEYVKIPVKMVEKALQTAPEKITLADRNGERTIFLEDHNIYFGAMADNIQYIDRDSGERRDLVLKDIRTNCLVADAAENIDFVASAGIVKDVKPEYSGRKIFKELIENTSKPVGFCCQGIKDMEDIIAIAEIVAGGPEKLKTNPFLYHYAEPITPLIHPEDSLNKMRLCAEAGIPIVYTPMPMGGATAPASPAGMLAINIAECLSGLVINQLFDSGAPFIFGGIPAGLDMKTSIFRYGAPDLYLQVAALTEMSHYYQLPMFGTAGISDSKFIDAQAGLEAGLSCLMSALSGANLVHDVGAIDHCEITSPEMILLTDEIVGMLKHMMGGIEINRETLCLDLIDKVGAGGNYLTEEHTLDNYKSFWYPQFLDKSTYRDDN
ncbi:MAG: trimethylamine methyltransferase family protein, partial [Halanaerobiales bacterium]